MHFFSLLGFKAHQQAALLCIEAAEGCGRFDMDVTFRERRQDLFFQGSGSFRVEAMGDSGAAADEAPILHLLEDGLQGFLFAPALVQLLQGPHFGGAAHHPDTQHTGDLGHSRIHTAVSGQVCQSFQREQQVGPLLVFPDLVPVR